MKDLWDTAQEFRRGLDDEGEALMRSIGATAVIDHVDKVEAIRKKRSPYGPHLHEVDWEAVGIYRLERGIEDPPRSMSCWPEDDEIAELKRAHYTAEQQRKEARRAYEEREGFASATIWFIVIAVIILAITIWDAKANPGPLVDDCFQSYVGCE